MTTTELQLLRIPEVAERLSLSKAKVYAMIASGDLPIIKLGRSTRVEAEALREFVRTQAEATERRRFGL